MAYKFKVGQAVKYVGKTVNFSPPQGALGKIRRVCPYGSNYVVDFSKVLCPNIGWIGNSRFHYEENELEAVDDGREEECVDAERHYPERAWTGC